MCSFIRLETRFEHELEELQIASKAIDYWFIQKGGHALNDNEYSDYCDISVVMESELETLEIHILHC